MNTQNIFGFILFLTGSLTTLHAMDAREISVDTVNYALAGTQGAQQMITFIKDTNYSPIGATGAGSESELFIFFMLHLRLSNITLSSLAHEITSLSLSEIIWVNSFASKSILNRLNLYFEGFRSEISHSWPSLYLTDATTINERLCNEKLCDAYRQLKIDMQAFQFADDSCQLLLLSGALPVRSRAQLAKIRAVFLSNLKSPQSTADAHFDSKDHEECIKHPAYRAGLEIGGYLLRCSEGKQPMLQELLPLITQHIPLQDLKRNTTEQEKIISGIVYSLEHHNSNSSSAVFTKLLSLLKCFLEANPYERLFEIKVSDLLDIFRIELAPLLAKINADQNSNLGSMI